MLRTEVAVGPTEYAILPSKLLSCVLLGLTEKQRRRPYPLERASLFSIVLCVPNLAYCSSSGFNSGMFRVQLTHCPDVHRICMTAFPEGKGICPKFLNLNLIE